MAGQARGLHLGIEADPAGGAGPGRPFLYDPDDLTTHAVCFGMTGSGKTGLCLVLLEEVLRLGIPVFAIDPKGDLANLMLAFPGLSGPEFEPWVDPERARADGLTPAQLAEAEARRWREGLAASGLGSGDVRALRERTEVVLYTPGSTAATPLDVLGGFAPPEGLDPSTWEEDPEPLRARIAGTVAALLGLVEAQADPARSPEGIFLARLFELRWRAGETLTLESIIREFADPGEPMRTMGAIDTETMLPRARRMELALALNGLLASPSFAAWTKGEPLDIGRMARAADGSGRPRASILYIAHLDDRQRVFFVTAFLQALVTWMRGQPGTSSLRALFYMDEIFGYFPPLGNPPAKEPLLTLLKQGRASGLGTLLATQNPVDVDYKGLANAGTWFIGRLQTEQDRSRLLDGLAGTGPIDRPRIESALATLPSRSFLLHNARRPGLTTFTTRWTMSYLRGPMTREEIRRLAAPRAALLRADPASPGPAASIAAGPGRAVREGVPAGIPEWFAPAPPGSLMRPALRARVRLLFEDTGAGVRHASEEDLLLGAAGILDPGGLPWERAVPLEREVGSTPPEGVRWDDLPDPLRTASGWRRTGASLKSHLSVSRLLPLMKCAPLKLSSRPGESKEEFAAHCGQEALRRQEEEARALGAKYEERLRRLQGRADKEWREMERDKQELQGRRMDEMVTAGETLLGIFLGGRRRSLSGAAGRRRMTSTAGARAGKSEAEYDAAREELERMQEEAGRAMDELEARWSRAAADIVERPVRTKKSGVEILELGLLWLPEES